MTQTIKDNKHVFEQKRQFCTFILEDQLFGVNILDVKEINATTEFTPIFHAPPEIKGYVNIRGQIHLIIDLRLLMGYKIRDIDKSSRLVLFKPSIGENFGVLVDKIGDVVNVDETQIEERSGSNSSPGQPPSARDQALNNLASFVCKLEDQLLVILDAKKLL
ncbi:Chemotaxis protein, CheW/CheV-like [Desulfonema limicola]|uniref:Chemotaxis protein, CheW/CheV-like n=1 Tax=Desulfonema limicola TaxID=45656 RepID=A0A975GJP3_9BACT|nr:chemotaxis protein CheW [Desulfonema limicola]QTA83712.1 Chemotaxis protein, CheW/CheV-like [Desulfonema limicola]